MPDTMTDSDTTTGAGTTTGTGMNTAGGQTTSGQITGGLAANSVTTGNTSKDTPMTGAMASAPANPQGGATDETTPLAHSQATGGGRATPDFGPLASGSLGGGDTMDDAGGEDQGALAGNQDVTTGDTETGNMGTDTAALGGGAALPGDLDQTTPDPTGSGDIPTGGLAGGGTVGGGANSSGMAQGEGVR